MRDRQQEILARYEKAQRKQARHEAALAHERQYKREYFADYYRRVIMKKRGSVSLEERKYQKRAKLVRTLVDSIAARRGVTAEQVMEKVLDAGALEFVDRVYGRKPSNQRTQPAFIRALSRALEFYLDRDNAIMF